MRPKRALISVWDKRGIVELSKTFIDLGIEIIATSGTYKLLKSKGILSKEVSEYTGQTPLAHQRVKTLHPKIFAGILSLRDEEIEPIDIIVCNLYPFLDGLKSHKREEEIIELIDIGGVSLLRAGAKNYRYVAVLSDPDDYQDFLKELRKGEISEPTLRRLAVKAWEIVAHYDALIFSYFNKNPFPSYLTPTYIKSLNLRYGENPHQKAAFYLPPLLNLQIEKLWGKELSYNNLRDIEAVIEGVMEFSNPASVIIKHTTPCGVGKGRDLKEAYEHAYQTDTKSPFGGVVGFNKPLDPQTAELLSKIFLEVVVAPDFDPESLSILKRKKNLRIIKFKGESKKRELHSILEGLLYQEKDIIDEDPSRWEVVTEREPNPEEREALEFAWKVVKHTKSNSVVLAKPQRTIGIGQGQTSRVAAVEIAIRNAEGRERGAVLASDGFFPFRDSIDLSATAGITAVVQPGGSIRDKEVIDACDEYKIAMLFTKVRHFRH